MLGVHSFALSDIDIQSEIDVLHLLFLLKESFSDGPQTVFGRAARKLEEYYQPLIKKTSKSYKKVTMLSEFLTHIREMIQAGIHIKAGQQLIRLGKGALTLTALVSEVYVPENRAVTEAVTHFLFDLKTLTDYGMNFDVNYYKNEQGTRITVILHLSPLMAFDSTINSMQEYESGNPHGNYEAEIFEKNLAAELSRYDIDLKDEIERSY